jgi:periplasmic copper chaperone A
MVIRARLLVAMATALVACQASAPRPAAVEVRDAWARATAPGQETGGVFLSLRNDGGEADRLLGGSTPAARSVEIHAMTMKGDVMRMRRQADVEIAANGAVELKPGGTHLMLMNLTSPLVAGTRFPLALRFAKSGGRQVQVKVLPIGSAGPRGAGDE